ncbi:hypothetical protein KHA80_04980 [Anaerobacillus sp. HL2]|nr:hypothetical protein KHA80_04980 [Anaerobacillus sp. HL2]
MPFHYLELPLCQWTSKYEPLVIQSIPRILVLKIGQAATTSLLIYLEAAELEEVVKNQVEQFSVQLEEIVLSISEK